jgi:hypothetical protein
MTMESKFPERENNRAPRTERQPSVLVWLKREAREAVTPRNHERFCFRHPAHLHVKKSNMKNLWLSLVAYSLGNLVFDGAPTVASWNRGALLEVGLNEGAKISSVSLVPVVLEDGLPRMEVTESNRFGSR